MGYNIVGLITDNELNDEKTVQDLFGGSLSRSIEINGEEALSTKFDDSIDVYSNAKGSLVFFDIQRFDSFTPQGLYVQFVIGDTSDTYCYKQYLDGKELRNFVFSQGEIIEDDGEGYIKEDDDFEEVVFSKIKEILGVNDVFELMFDRYE